MGGGPIERLPGPRSDNGGGFFFRSLTFEIKLSSHVEGDQPVPGDRTAFRIHLGPLTDLRQTSRILGSRVMPPVGGDMRRSGFAPELCINSVMSGK